MFFCFPFFFWISPHVPFFFVLLLESQKHTHPPPRAMACYRWASITAQRNQPNTKQRSKQTHFLRFPLFCLVFCFSAVLFFSWTFFLFFFSNYSPYTVMFSFHLSIIFIIFHSFSILFRFSVEVVVFSRFFPDFFVGLLICASIPLVHMRFVHVYLWTRFFCSSHKITPSS